MFRFLLIGLLLILFLSCDYYIVNSYKNGVGYINPRTAIGPKDFSACYEDGILMPYYSRDQRAGFAQDKDSLRRYFASKFDNYGIINESGYITVRFIINCKGEAGRFEIRQVGMDYKKKKFHKNLVEGLLELTQELKDWQPLKRSDMTYDSMFHLTFKIENGELVEILP